MTLPQVFGIVRHTLTIIGTAMAMLGYQLDPTGWQTITGSALALGAIIWSVASKQPDPTIPPTI